MSSVSTDVLIPSPLADYKSPPNMRFSPQVWDAVFKSLGERLRALEGQRVTLQATIDALQTSALQTVTATITAEINARRADLAELKGEFKAVSDAYIQLVSGGVYADGIQLKPAIDGVAGHTVQAALAALAEGAKTTGEAIKNIRIVKHLAYDDRAQLRAINGPAESNAVVRGIGFFVWVAGSTEPDDDETCFKTTDGAWLLEAVSMDAVGAYVLPIIDAAIASINNGDPPNYRIQRYNFINTISSIGVNQSTSINVDVIGAGTGDAVIIAPPAKISNGLPEYTFYGYVSKSDQVTVVFANSVENQNPGFTTGTYGVNSPWTLLLVKAN